MSNITKLIIIGIILFISLYSINYSTNILLTGTPQEIQITLVAVTAIAVMAGYALYRTFSRR